MSLRILIGIAALGFSTWTCAEGRGSLSSHRGALADPDVTRTETYPGATRSSQYVTVRDGTRLAIDIYRPSVGGKAVEKPLPVILAAALTYRSAVSDGKVGLISLNQYLMDVLKHGYVIAALETRGHGASFGTTSPLRIETAEDYWDLYDVMEWLGSQSWSTGKIGMAGCSNQGLTQFRAAALMPPQLKAIAPTSAPVDWSVLGSVNGITARGFAEWPHPTGIEAAPVDEDTEGTLLQAAVMEHGAWGKARITRPFRDTPLTRPGLHVLPTNWWDLLPSFTLSRIPVFQYAGWRDFFSEQSFALYRSLARQSVPQKLIVGPWYHCDWHLSGVTDAAGQTVRWYDHWLKGINDGFLDEPPIRYYVVGAPAGHEWKTAHTWPLPNEKLRNYFLGDDGSLRRQKPTKLHSKDDYIVNYAATTAPLATRWNMEAITQKNRGLLPIPTAAVDATSLSYTSAPLEQDSELTGFPRVTLWVSSTAEDQDFFIYLEEVDLEGKSTLLTDGAIRASNRANRRPPFDNQGLPWHPGYKADQERLEPGVPTKLEWALFPFSNYIKKGHRLRIAINSFDKDAWDTPEISPAPKVSLYHDAQHPSSITLPFIEK